MCIKIIKKLFKHFKHFFAHNVRKMSQNYKNRDMLKNLPFYSEEIKSVKKKDKKN